MKKSVHDRFYEKVNKRGPLPHCMAGLKRCWLWTSWMFSDGYGGFRFNGKVKKAHNVAYFLRYGRWIPSNRQPDHLCSNRACVRLAHIEIVTPYENFIRSNNPMAINARKINCKRGHCFDKKNTYLSQLPSGKQGRRCRICRRNDMRRRRRLGLA